MNQQIKKRIEEINSGKIPEGYTKTDFGIFPNDWENGKTYGDLFSFFSSLSIPREELSSTGYPYLHYGDIHREDFYKVSYEQYSELPKCNIELGKVEQYKMNDGDIAFLDASEDLEGTSRCVLIENNGNKPFLAGLHTIVAREKDTQLSKYYKQYITLPQFIKKQFYRLASGFKVYGLNRNSLCQIKFAYPKNIKEQEKIAEILMKWDTAIDLQEKYIQKLEERKIYIINKNFSYHNENMRFKDLYIKAGEGGTPNTEKKEFYDNGDIPFVKIDNLYSKYLEKVETYITKLGMEKSGAWIIPENSLIFSNGATIGEATINKIKVTTKQGILGIIPNEKIDIEYFYYLVKSDYFLNKIKSITTKGTMVTAYLKDIDKLKLYIPEINRQKIIASYLSEIDKEISLNKDKLEKLKLQRKALQQYLLTGVVRV